MYSTESEREKESDLAVKIKEQKLFFPRIQQVSLLPFQACSFVARKKKMCKIIIKNMIKKQKKEKRVVKKGTGCSWLSTFGSEKKNKYKRSGKERGGMSFLCFTIHDVPSLLTEKDVPSLPRLVFSSPLLWGPTTNPIHTLRSYPLGF